MNVVRINFTEAIQGFDKEIQNKLIINVFWTTLSQIFFSIFNSYEVISENVR